MSVGIYMRVSKGKGQDLESQKPDLDRWVAAQSDACTFYTDKQSGKTMDRPGFNRLMADIAMGKIKTVVVWRLDRLGRTARGLTALIEDWSKAKVNLISLKDGLDLSTPAGRLMANVLASVAAYETEVRAERIHAGLEVAKANGVKLGRPKQKGDGKGKRIKVTTEQETIVKRLKGEGQGVSAIARTTGLSRPTIYSILDNNGLVDPEKAVTRLSATEGIVSAINHVVTSPV